MHSLGQSSQCRYLFVISPIIIGQAGGHLPPIRE